MGRVGGERVEDRGRGDGMGEEGHAVVPPLGHKPRAFLSFPDRDVVQVAHISGCKEFDFIIDIG